jgi:hypothetical protein
LRSSRWARRNGLSKRQAWLMGALYRLWAGVLKNI